MSPELSGTTVYGEFFKILLVDDVNVITEVEDGEEVQVLSVAENQVEDLNNKLLRLKKGKGGISCTLSPDIAGKVFKDGKPVNNPHDEFLRNVVRVLAR